MTCRSNRGFPENSMGGTSLVNSKGLESPTGRAYPNHFLCRPTDILHAGFQEGSNLFRLDVLIGTENKRHAFGGKMFQFNGRRTDLRQRKLHNDISLPLMRSPLAAWAMFPQTSICERFPSPRRTKSPSSFMRRSIPAAEPVNDWA